MKNAPFVLVIMDGIGNNPNPRANAVYHAKTPTIDALKSAKAVTELITFGHRVGLPDEQMGNSEVGHLNIGGGRVVEQELLRINNAIREQRLPSIPELSLLLKAVKNHPDRALHFVGLASTGGVHSSLSHLQALLQVAAAGEIERVFIHAITDGRDTPPKIALEETEKLLSFVKNQLANQYPKTQISIASIIGRYHAMDRDSRWDRTERAYRLFTEGMGEEFSDPIAALQTRRAAGCDDEFLEPIRIVQSGQHSGTIQDNDGVVFFNFRADRMRQLVQAFVAKEGDSFHFSRKVCPRILKICTLTEYESHFPVDVIFKPFFVKNHFGDVVSQAGLSQLRVAETEKYPHVTYFFNGGVEVPVPGEKRILVPSPRDVATYDMKPEMSALLVTEKLISTLEQGEVRVVIVNYANGDMVGHTGNFDAAVKAVETVDSCVGQVLKVVRKLGGSAIVTADHGNAEQMVDYETGQPHTAHTLFPVPFFLVGDAFANVELRNGGSLCDIAPTACMMLGLRPPVEMTGRSLFGG